MYFYLPLFLSFAAPFVLPDSTDVRLAVVAAALSMAMVLAVVTFRFVGRPITDFGDRILDGNFNDPTVSHPPHRVR
jgi:peptidoglycan/LPS O-acetylase OafA/YrhL